ncbi:hypothetical protein T492DRAFT_217893 [Pavlovales sp. CCMP2436]|nr:hypothetical protein T492DRAFT_217893 [Pavlovales sp. CCMP2436]
MGVEREKGRGEKGEGKSSVIHHKRTQLCQQNTVMRNQMARFYYCYHNYDRYRFINSNLMILILINIIMMTHAPLVSRVHCEVKDCNIIRSSQMGEGACITIMMILMIFIIFIIFIMILLIK